MLHAKVFHVLMIIAWMAGIFYLPRIFVHFVDGKNAGEDVRRLKVMAQKLHSFTTIMGIFALGSGFFLWLNYGFMGGWLHAKLLFVFGLVIYQIVCFMHLKAMKQDRLNKSSFYLRVFNEIPLFLLIGILIFVIMKPF